MASKELLTIMEIMRSQKSAAGNDAAENNADIETMRAGMEQMQAGLKVPDDVIIESISADGVSAEWVTTPESEDRVIIYYHGGGYVMGSVNTHRELCSRLSRSVRARVLNVDYRLAPEHVFPAAVNDGVTSYRWLLNQGIDPNLILMAGDSAGGGLTLSTLVSLKDLNIPLPAGAFMFSPWTDLAATGDSVLSRKDLDPMISPTSLDHITNMYIGEQPPDHPLISPLYADLSSLPPLLIQVGGAEILYDDSTRLANAADKAGVDITLQEWEAAFHVFQAVPVLPEASQALEKVALFADRVMS